MKKTKKGRSNFTDMDLVVAKMLKNKRITSGLAQQQLAKVIGVSIQQFQKYEKGVNRISSGKLYLLASYLQIPISYFFDTSNDMEIDDLKYSSENEIRCLIKNFSNIKNKDLRQNILNMIQNMGSI